MVENVQIYTVFIDAKIIKEYNKNYILNINLFL